MKTIDLPEEVVRDMLEILRIKLEEKREELVAEMRAAYEETFARLEARAEAKYREMQAAYEEIDRLRQLERLRITYEAEPQDEGSQLQ